MRDALDLYDLPFYNNSGEEIPPFAVMQVDEWKDDANDRDYFRVRKPDGSGKMFIVNGPLEVAIAGDGMGSRREGIPARYLSGTPAPDEEWGPTSGSWNLSASGSGFIVVGGNETLGGVTVTHVNLAASSSGNVIYAQVVSNVADSDPTGSFYNAVGPYVGSIPTGGTGTFININGEEFAADQWVKFFQRKDTGDWHPERGGLAGSIVLRFETTAAKAWDATTVAGVILDASDTPVGGAITLTDRAPAKHEASSGSRGWCVRNGDDTYWIVTMDSPARWVEGTLAAEWSLGGSFGRIEVVDYWGAAPNHLAPVTYSHDFGDEDVRDVLDVYDPVKVQHRKGFAGETIRAKWDEKRAKWVLETLPLYLTIKGTSPGVTRATSTFTLGSPAAVNGVLPSGTITVKNEPPLDSPSGRTIYARFNVAAGSSVVDCWDTGDAGNILELIRGFADWTAGDDQVLDHDADGDPHWHDTGPCTPA